VTRLQAAPGDRSPADEELVMVPEAAEIARARTFVDTTIESWGLHSTDDVALATSEAVTNSVIHAVTDTVTLSVRRSGSGVHIAVADDDATAPAVRPPSADRLGGLGMVLIEALARRWGVTQIENDGKRVWFEMDLPGSVGLD